MAVTLSPQIRILAGGQQRVLTGIGKLDPGSIDAYRKAGGYRGLTRAVTERSPDEVITEVFAARLRGRGGAGYPVADKWRAARSAPGERKIVVANLMGADPMSLGDRTLAEGNPHLVLEGLLIASAAVGASEAILAVRRDWTLAIERLQAAVEAATAAHLAGYLMLGTDVSVQVSVWEGSGAYVAGEETALIHALQGDRGMPSIRPPYPAERGLWGAPTVVHNAETLAHVAWILGHSAAAFAKLGPEKGPGTKLVTIAGAVQRAGVGEVALGTPLADILALAGGATATVKAAFVGGPGAGALAADELATT
ncbi:MAG: SLBB domain-containing protein, partial [Acidimicrobiales bacterium]